MNKYLAVIWGFYSVFLNTSEVCYKNNYLLGELFIAIIMKFFSYFIAGSMISYHFLYFSKFSIDYKKWNQTMETGWFKRTALWCEKLCSHYAIVQCTGEWVKHDSLPKIIHKMGKIMKLTYEMELMVKWYYLASHLISVGRMGHLTQKWNMIILG